MKNLDDVFNYLDKINDLDRNGKPTAKEVLCEKR